MTKGFQKITRRVVAVVLIVFLMSSTALAAGLGDRLLYWGTKGEDVKELQEKLRILGYQISLDGIFGNQTSTAVRQFQQDEKLVVDGMVGTSTVNKLNQKVTEKQGPAATTTTYVTQKGDSLWAISQKFNVSIDRIMQVNNMTSTLLYPGQSIIIPVNQTPAPVPDRHEAPEVSRSGETRSVRLVEWTEVNTLFPRGDVVTVTDFHTGKTFRVKRYGGYNHADSEPLTAQDAAVMKGIYGGVWSWARRPIIVTVAGQHLAASMNGMPHGGGSITNNNFDGHFCIHFLNSRTHGSNSLDQAHQNAIKTAAGVR